MDRSSQFRGTDVFIGCSPEDQPYLEQLRIHLKPLEGNFIQIWDEDSVSPGEQYCTEIDRIISVADVAVLLVSADFLASSEMTNYVLPPILEKVRLNAMTILSVMIGYCALQHSSLASYKPINNPTQPLKIMTEGEQEMVWQKVAQAIRAIHQERRKKDRVMNAEQPSSNSPKEVSSIQTNQLKEAELVLDGPSIEQLAAALLHAYPSTSELKLLVSYELYENIEVIAAGSSLAEKVHSLVIWTTSHGKVRALIDGALRRNPGNPKLRKFTIEHGF